MRGIGIGIGMGMMNNNILAAGCKEAAALLPTPFYLYDAALIRARHKALSAALPAGWRLYYAAKANPNIAVLSVYRGEGALAECASAGEMEACVKAGYSPRALALSGPAKGKPELDFIRAHGVRVVHVETVEELAALDALGKKIRVAVRVNIDVGISARAAGRVMSGGRDKFGFSPSAAEHVLAERGMYRNLEFCGFHIYMGTQVRKAETWISGARIFLEYVRRTAKRHSFRPSYLNFGGGLGIPYREGEREFDLARLKRGLNMLAAEVAASPALAGAECHMEPGRWLMGPCGAYVMRVLAVKRMGGARFAVTDGGIHHALLPFRISREFPARLLNRKGGPALPYILGGPLCTTLDQSELPVSLPELKSGDVVALFNSGAYGYASGMHYFLSHPLPAEVLKDGKELTVIREASLFDHLFRYQKKRRIKG